MLIIPIWVNNHEVRRVELVRVDPPGQPYEGQHCSYGVRYYDNQPTGLFLGYVGHPYVPNNPLPLTIRALEFVSEAQEDR